MNTANFSNTVQYDHSRPIVTPIISTNFSKEIQITMGAGVEMKEHKTTCPIIVHVLEGTIQFGVEKEVHYLSRGDILSLSGNVPHNLIAIENSIIRLTISKLDSTNRVADIVKV